MYHKSLGLNSLFNNLYWIGESSENSGLELSELEERIKKIIETNVKLKVIESKVSQKKICFSVYVIVFAWLLVITCGNSPADMFQKVGVYALVGVSYYSQCCWKNNSEAISWLWYDPPIFCPTGKRVVSKISGGNREAISIIQLDKTICVTNWYIYIVIKPVCMVNYAGPSNNTIQVHVEVVVECFGFRLNQFYVSSFESLHYKWFTAMKTPRFWRNKKYWRSFRK